MAINAILFDIDGTLVDSNEQHVLASEEAFASVGARFDRHAIHDQIGKGTDMLLPAPPPEADGALQEQLGDAHGEAFKAWFLDKTAAFPGSRELLVDVGEAGQKVVLDSTASKPELDHYLGLLDTRGLFSATTSADDVESTKPAPDTFATSFKKVAPLRPDAVMVVGDTPYDIEAAVKCGITVIGLRSDKFIEEAMVHAGAMVLRGRCGLARWLCHPAACRHDRSLKARDETRNCRAETFEQ